MTITAPPIIPALPLAPSRQRPEDFSDEADAFLAAMQPHSNAVQAVASNVYTNAQEATFLAAEAAASALAADVSEAAAASAATAAAQSAGAAKWVSGTNYADGAVAWSPITRLSYRRRGAGGGSLDPSVDSAFWTLAVTAQLQLIVVTGTAVQMSAGGQYMLTSTAASVATLPASAIVGDYLGVLVANGRIDNAVARNGHLIERRSENLIVNNSVARFGLVYGGPAVGWIVSSISLVKG